MNLTGSDKTKDIAVMTIGVGACLEGPRHGNRLGLRDLLRGSGKNVGARKLGNSDWRLAEDYHSDDGVNRSHHTLGLPFREVETFD